MKDETMLLLRLINNNKSLNEISQILGVTNKQLFTKLSILRSCGYLVDREYFYNGDIHYSIKNPFQSNMIEANQITINTPNNIQKIRILLTADTHLGNIDDDIASIDAIINYCIQEGIHQIINAGDFFEGIYQDDFSKINDATEQIQYGLKNYPYDKNILTSVCLGNHDASFWLENGIDIKTILENRRHDIIPLGYGKGIINIGGNQILVYHPIDRHGIAPREINNTNQLVIRGHSHKFKIKNMTNGLMIYVPTLSKVSTPNDIPPFPSFIDMELTLEDGIIKNEYFQQFLFINNSFIRINEINYGIKIPKITSQLQQNKSLKPKLSNFTISSNEKLNEQFELHTSTEIDEVTIKPEKNIISSQQIAQNDIYKGMNQIEKFNARYGINSINTRKLKR